METLDDIKHRIKNIPRRKYALDFKTRSNHSHGKLKVTKSKINDLIFGFQGSQLTYAPL